MQQISSTRDQRSALSVLSLLAMVGMGDQATAGSLPQAPAASFSELEPDSPQSEQVLSPGFAYRALHAKILQDLLRMGMFNASLPSRETLERLTPNPELSPALAINTAHITPENRARVLKEWQAALSANAGLDSIADRILRVNSGARGNPMGLTVLEARQRSTPLSSTEQDDLFAILLANPFLAECWNAQVTRLPMMKGLQAGSPTEALVLSTWVAPITGTVHQRWLQGQEVTSLAQDIELLAQRARENNAVGWSTRDAKDFIELNDALLAKIERMARGIADVRYAAEAVSSLGALAALASSPTQWSNFGNYPARLYESTARFAWAISASGLEKAERESIAADVLNLSRNSFRLVLRSIDDAQKVMDDGHAGSQVASEEISRHWVAVTTEEVDLATARLLAGKLDGKLFSAIASTRDLPSGLLSAPAYYQGTELLKLWSERALRHSGEGLSLVECEPKSHNGAAAIYGLSTLSPSRHPALFGSWAGMEGDSRAMNIDLFDVATRAIAEQLLEDPELSLETRDALKERGILGQQFISEITTRGIGNMSHAQSDMLRRLFQGLVEQAGDGQGVFQEGGWLIASEKVSAVKDFAQQLLTEGTVLNNQLKEIESYRIAARRLTEAFPLGNEAYQNLRKQVLSIQDNGPFGFVSSADILKVLEDMQANPNYAVDVLARFLSRHERDQRQFALLAEHAHKVGGAREPKLDRCLARIGRMEKGE